MNACVRRLLCVVPCAALALATAAGAQDGYDGDRDSFLLTDDVRVISSGRSSPAGGARRPAERKPRQRASGRRSGGVYDTLPMTFRDMSEYDRIAMEPYRDRYDDLPVAEKAELYGRQFEYMHSRAAVFDPALFAPPEERQPEPEPEPPRETFVRQDGKYDYLPLRFAEMSKYDQIAMEPYRDRYDAMPIAEKADVYSRQFEFLHDRSPHFDPAIMGAREAFRQARAAPVVNVYEAKKHLYKPAVPKKRVRRPPPGTAEDGGTDSLLKALPGPWEQVPQPEPEPAPEEAFPPEPGIQDYPRDGLRMENLRRGWNAADVMRGARQR